MLVWYIENIELEYKRVINIIHWDYRAFRNITWHNIKSLVSTNKSNTLNITSASAYSNQKYEFQTPTIFNLQSRSSLNFFTNQDTNNHIDMTLFVNMYKQLQIIHYHLSQKQEKNVVQDNWEFHHCKTIHETNFLWKE